ncbi:MAG: hypothetical protein Q8M16_10560 [Pirellulaceae bacterium]|nr:hypothetical protein [Pirellulaceae bacterium]
MKASTVIITVLATLTAVVFLTVATGVAGFAALVMLGQRQYGLRMEHKNFEVYYTSKVTEAEAKQFIMYLALEQDSSNNRITFQLDRSGDDFLVRMCAQEHVYTTNQADDLAEGMRNEIQTKYFMHENVVLEACDEMLRTKKTFRANESPSVK